MATGAQRLARHVIRDRKARWRSRQAFAAAAGVSKRTVDRLELGEASAYRETTKARIEAALDWTDGSFDRILRGGRPSYVRDPLLAELERNWPQLSRDARLMLVRLSRGT